MQEQHITLTGKVNPATGQMNYEGVPFAGGVGNPELNVIYDTTCAMNTWPIMQQGTVMFTPFPNHTTELASSIYSPCSIVGCLERANPLNVVESTLDVFGSPQVRVHLCDSHYRLFGSATDEHAAVTDGEKPDIAVEEKPLRTGGIAIVGEGGNDEIVHLPQGTSVYPVVKEQ